MEACAFLYLPFISQHSWLDSSTLLCVRVVHSFPDGCVVFHFAHVAILTHFTIDGHLCCFQFGAIMNNDAMNTLCLSSDGRKNSVG